MAGMADPRDTALDPQLQNYGWRKLADLIDLLKAHRLLMFRRQRVGPFTVTSGQGDITATSPITIGTSGTWNTPRPVWIDAAGVIYTAGSTPRPELPMRVFTVREWKDITVKGITSTLSRALIYDQQFTATGTTGLGHIYLYPVPSTSFQVVLYVPQAVDEFANDANGNPDYSTTIALPPGYRMMLVSNLAVLVALGVTDIPRVEALALKTLGEVSASNAVQHMDALVCESAVLAQDNRGGSWDWIGGGFQ